MAEAMVAIIRLKLSNKSVPSTQDYEICIKSEPSVSKNFGAEIGRKDYNITKRVTVGGHTVGEDVFKLPTLSFEPSQMCTIEDLLHDYFKRTGNSIRRVVRISLQDDVDQKSNPKHRIPGLSLFCIPVFVKESVEIGNSRYENLQKLVHLCHNQPEMFEIHSKNMLLIVEKWLMDSQRLDPNFLSCLFMRDAVRIRIQRCAHNPAYIGFQDQCFRTISHSVRSTTSADLDDRVHSANFARLAMLQYNKFHVTILNPAFNPTKNGDYFYEGIERCARRASSNTSQDLRSRVYPLHKAAEMGNIAEIERLLNSGIDSNSRDDDYWTPLHYACFYGNLECVRALLNSPQMTSINVQNRGGTTALHYAVINGNEDIVELLTSHASIDVGLRPIDYCRNNIGMQKMIDMQIFKSKVNIETAIGGFSIKLSSDSQSTVEEILERLAEETHLNRHQIRCFAIFIYSDSLALQLRSDSLVEEKLKIDKWNLMLKKLICSENPHETPRLKLKRNAYATLEMELLSKVEQNKIGRSTLIDEAINAYRKGHLVGNSKEEMAKMASIVARKLYGKEYKPSCKNIWNVYPQYMIDNHNKSKLEDRLKGMIKRNETKNDIELENDFLSMARGLVTYGASFFEVEIFTKKNMVARHGLVGLNEHGVHIILKKSWIVKNLRYNEFQPIFRDSKTIEIDAQKTHNLHYILVSSQIIFLKGILQKFSV